MKDKIEFDKIFDERNIYVLVFNLRHVIQILSFRIVNLLCCGGHFSKITFIDAKTRYRGDMGTSIRRLLGTSSGRNFAELGDTELTFGGTSHLLKGRNQMTLHFFPTTILQLS